ncbi:MAG: hypothetical protein ACOZF2_05920 [Thermodesulfobacteriota bacterium]
MSSQKKGGCCGIFLAIFGILLLLGLIIRGFEKGIETIKGPTQSANEVTDQKKIEENQAKTKQPEPEPPPLTSAQHLAEAKKALSDTSNSMPFGRLGDAENHLKAIPENAEEYSKAKRLLKEVKKKQKQLMAKAKVVLEKYMTQKRKEFADDLERRYLDKGMDIRITVSGRANTTIKLRYVLFSRPLVYKLAKEGFLDNLVKGGFKKAIFTDGFRHSWTYDLSK